MFSRQRGGSQKASDHLANQQTLLDWIATGLSIIALGFVIALVDRLLRELGWEAIGASTLLGVALPILGLLLIGGACFHFWRIRRALDEERFCPRTWYPVVLTCVTCLIGLFVALLLWMTW